MFYFLSTLRDISPVFNVFRYITFRSGAAAVTSFFLCMVLAPVFIRAFRRAQIKDDINRDYCEKLSAVQSYKEGTPTMGGVFVIGSVLASVALWADLSNSFVLITAFTCLWLALVGFFDDYFKIRKKKHLGLSARTKFLWQCLLGTIVGCFIVKSPEISTLLDVPFFKNLVIDLGVFYVFLAVFIIVGTSNAVNLTDGLDGLAIGCVLVVSMAMGALSYISGNAKFAEYLLLPFIAKAGELSVFCSAILGASLGFLWFNCYPASIFMGDVGSLALGGTLGLIAILIKKELLLVLLGGIFVFEVLSVLLQVGSMKLRKKRIFRMSPFHHHLQLSGWDESKIIIRFWIVAIILALLTLTTLKIR